MPRPAVTGPIGDEGIRTGEPYAATMAPLPGGWVEQEFFFSGTARTYSGSGGSSEYRQRILVRRPTSRAEFNGTIVFNWNNVTVPHDGNPVGWESVYDTVYSRGFAFVSVSVQRIGTDGPLGLKQYDPVRYGTLNHPGDGYSLDIFSQAAQAAITPKVMGNLLPCVQRRLAMGASGSSDFLKTYLDDAHKKARVFDGYQPQINITGYRVPRNLVPILWVNSQSDAPGNPKRDADKGLVRVWQLPGIAHINYSWATYQSAQLTYDYSNGLAGEWDTEEAGAWGYQAPAPGVCLPDNYYPSSYAWGAALVALDKWVRTGVAPKPQPRLAQTGSGDLIFDKHGNAVGGVRSPFVDVPIATYHVGVGLVPEPSDTEDPCGRIGGRIPLKGTTKVFDAATLAELYPTPSVYIKKFNAAIDRALAAGTLLPEGAKDLRRRARYAAQFIADTTG